MVFWVSGVRVGSILQARWENTDLAKGIIVLPASVTKQKKDHVIQIHQAADNLLAIRPEHGTGLVFPWDHHIRTLDDEWDRIQTAAGIKLPCVDPRPHTCTKACHLFGFHDLRRSLATLNHFRVELADLMAQMGHSNASTTKLYIKAGEQLNPQKRFDAFVGDFTCNPRVEPQPVTSDLT